MPGHQITIEPTRLHVRIDVSGVKLAETDRPVLLHETGLPTRYYIPPEDVSLDLLRPTNHRSTCPFKGEASYWSAQVGEEVHDSLVWSYEEPIPQAEGISGLMCFYDDRVDVTIGEEGNPRSDSAS